MRTLTALVSACVVVFVGVACSGADEHDEEARPRPPLDVGAARLALSGSVSSATIAFDGCVRGRCGIHISRADGTGYAYVARGSQPKWSPDGRRITFRCERERNPTEAEASNNKNDDVCIANARGGGFRNLTRNRVGDYSTAWSPDGRWIAFASSRHGVFAYANDVYVMRPDGTGVRRITREIGVDEYPSWSSDGTAIAYSCSRAGDPDSASGETGFGICVVDVASARSRVVPTTSARCLSPAFARRSKRLAFTCERETAGGWVGTIYVTDADGGAARPLVRGARVTVWSGDDREILFRRGRTLFAVHVATGRVRRLGFRLPEGGGEFDVAFARARR